MHIRAQRLRSIQLHNTIPNEHNQSFILAKSLGFIRLEIARQHEMDTVLDTKII